MFIVALHVPSCKFRIHTCAETEKNSMPPDVTSMPDTHTHTTNQTTSKRSNRQLPNETFDEAVEACAPRLPKPLLPHRRHGLIAQGRAPTEEPRRQEAEADWDRHPADVDIVARESVLDDKPERRLHMRFKARAAHTRPVEPARKGRRRAAQRRGKHGAGDASAEPGRTMSPLAEFG